SAATSCCRTGRGRTRTSSRRCSGRRTVRDLRSSLPPAGSNPAGHERRESRMEPKKRLPSRAVLLGLMAAMASSLPAAGAIGGAAANTAPNQVSTAATTGAASNLQDLYDCSCVQTYRDGSEASVSSCDDTQEQCADFDVLEACQKDPDGPDCNYL